MLSVTHAPNRPAETGHPLDIGPLPPRFLPSNPNCQMAGAEQRNPSHLDSGLLISLHFLWHTTGTAQEVSAMATENQHTAPRALEVSVNREGFDEAHLGGANFSSKNSSILFTSVLTSPSKVMKGGLVPGAKFCRSAGFLGRGEGQCQGWDHCQGLTKPPPHTHTYTHQWKRNHP